MTELTLVERVAQATTVTDAMELWQGLGGSNKDVKRIVLDKALSLAKDEDDLREICYFFVDCEDILDSRRELSLVFKKAEELLGKSETSTA